MWRVLAGKLPGNGCQMGRRSVLCEASVKLGKFNSYQVSHLA